MIVVGVDVGLVHSGVAVLSGKNKCLWRGTINIEGEGTGPRFSILREAFEEVFARLQQPPDAVVIEEPDCGYTAATTQVRS